MSSQGSAGEPFQSELSMIHASDDAEVPTSFSQSLADRSMIVMEQEDTTDEEYDNDNKPFEEEPSYNVELNDSMYCFCVTKQECVQKLHSLPFYEDFDGFVRDNKEKDPGHEAILLGANELVLKHSLVRHVDPKQVANWVVICINGEFGQFQMESLEDLEFLHSTAIGEFLHNPIWLLSVAPHISMKNLIPIETLWRMGNRFVCQETGKIMDKCFAAVLLSINGDSDGLIRAKDALETVLGSPTEMFALSDDALEDEGLVIHERPSGSEKADNAIDFSTIIEYLDRATDMSPAEFFAQPKYAGIPETDSMKLQEAAKSGDHGVFQAPQSYWFASAYGAKHHPEVLICYPNIYDEKDWRQAHKESQEQFKEECAETFGQANSDAAVVALMRALIWFQTGQHGTNLENVMNACKEMHKLISTALDHHNRKDMVAIPPEELVGSFERASPIEERGGGEPPSQSSISPNIGEEEVITSAVVQDEGTITVATVSKVSEEEVITSAVVEDEGNMTVADSKSTLTGGIPDLDSMVQLLLSGSMTSEEFEFLLQCHEENRESEIIQLQAEATQREYDDVCLRARLALLDASSDHYLAILEK